jgi:ComF family protein
MDIVENESAMCPKCWGDLQFVSLPKCEICGEAFEFEIRMSSPVCGGCLIDGPYFDKARHLLVYKSLAKTLIKKFKFGGWLQLAGYFAKWLSSYYKELIGQSDLILPVPMHKLKRIRRGYNQSLELSRRIATQFNASNNNFGNFDNFMQASNNPRHEAGLLLKSRPTRSQASLSKLSRQKNLRGSMYINSSDRTVLKNKNVLLVDDVITTGATIEESSRLLKKAGAATVNVIAIAKTHARVQQ